MNDSFSVAPQEYSLAKKKTKQNKTASLLEK